MTKFRRNFKLWDKAFSSIVLTEEPMRNGKDYFIFQCQKKCGGWGDRMKGAMFAYIVANLTGRIFKARFVKPDCDYSNYLVPNRYDWYLSKNFTPASNETVFNNHFGDSRLRDKMESTNLTEKFKLNKKYHFFSGNLQFIINLKNNTMYKDQISWMKDLNRADIYAAIYTRLFRLSDRLQSTLNHVLDQALPTRQHRLICVHVRLGEAAIQSDPIRMSIEKLPKVWAWIENQTRSDLDKVFVTSDSHKVVELAYNQTFGDRVISFPGAVIHSDKYKEARLRNKTLLCSGMERMILEYHTLMNCDILVKGHSGLSALASMVRGTNQGLYCLQKTGDIVPCKRDKFRPEFL